MSTQDLFIWTIYNRPLDYPDKIVAREFIIRPQGAVASGEMFVADTIAEARALLPPGLVSLGRQDADDPVIVESLI